MIARVKMQLLRWRRRTLGMGLLVAAVFLASGPMWRARSSWGW